VLTSTSTRCAQLLQEWSSLVVMPCLNRKLKFIKQRFVTDLPSPKLIENGDRPSGEMMNWIVVSDWLLLHRHEIEMRRQAVGRLSIS
jgi:hypothetical protein